LKDTTAKGSKPALSTSVRILIPSTSPWTASRDPIHPAAASAGAAAGPASNTAPKQKDTVETDSA
jgi:hypothetical protein